MENNSEERRCIYVCGICNEKMRGKALFIGCIQCRTWVDVRKTCANLSYKKEPKKKWKNYKCPTYQQKTKKNSNVSFLIISHYFSAILWSRMLPKLKIYFSL